VTLGFANPEYSRGFLAFMFGAQYTRDEARAVLGAHVRRCGRVWCPPTQAGTTTNPRGW